MILLKEVEDARRFGDAELKDGKVISIVEKPHNPVTNLAVTGFYLYDAKVFSYIKTLERSARGELEITDVNNRYIKDKELSSEVLEGWWTDAGTFPSLHRAANLVAETGANNV